MRNCRPYIVCPIAVAGFLVFNTPAHGCPYDELALDCCTVSTAARGCTDEACCDAVCACDSFCCDNRWDVYCVRQAQQICGLDCGVSPCAGTSCGGSCCSAHPSKGCNNESCCDAVCAVDPACCNFEWDSWCAVRAGILCSTCPSPCPAQGDCCTANGSPGWNDMACCEVVCLFGPPCCGALGGTWDSSCANFAAGVCEICCSTNAECDDSDECTSDTCVNGSCENTPVNCNDGNPCTDDFCDSQTGCFYTDLPPPMIPLATLVQHLPNARSAAGGAKPSAA
jgi:hypothetical protein